jgi:hypothetical protein
LESGAVLSEEFGIKNSNMTPHRVVNPATDTWVQEATNDAFHTGFRNSTGNRCVEGRNDNLVAAESNRSPMACEFYNSRFQERNLARRQLNLERFENRHGGLNSSEADYQHLLPSAIGN